MFLGVGFVVMICGGEGLLLVSSVVFVDVFVLFIVVVDMIGVGDLYMGVLIY